MGKYLLTIVLSVFSTFLFGQSFETNDTQRANLLTVAKWEKAEMSKAATNSLILVKRGFRFDKAREELIVLAEECGLDDGAPVEFPIIGELSDRAYEALFRTFATPMDIVNAIESMGVPRGENVSNRKQNFWPKGEPVAIEVRPFGEKNAPFTPIQKYILDKEKRSSLNVKGFLYCGSIDDPQSKDGARTCQTEAPNSILATYNDPQTVFDMPFAINQTEAYDRFVLAQNTSLKPFGLYEIRFSPIKREDGKNYLLDYTLNIAPGNSGKKYNLSLNGKGEEIASLTNLVNHLEADQKAGFDPFITFVFDEGLTLDDVVVESVIIAKLEETGCLKVSKPMPGTIFYKSYLPNPTWRIAKERPSQPWELHICHGENDSFQYRLVKTLEDWTNTDSLDPILSTKDFVVKKDEILSTIEANKVDLPVLFVFAPKKDPISSFMPIVRKLRDIFPTVYIFGE